MQTSYYCFFRLLNYNLHDQDKIIFKLLETNNRYIHAHPVYNTHQLHKLSEHLFILVIATLICFVALAAQVRNENIIGTFIDDGVGAQANTSLCRITNARAHTNTQTHTLVNWYYLVHIHCYIVNGRK